MGGHCFGKWFVRRLAKRVRAAGVDREPILQRFPQLIGHRDVTNGFLDRPVLLLLADRDLPGFKVDVFDS